MFCHKQLVHSTPRLSAPSCHLLAKINALGTLFTTRHLCLKCLKADHYGNHRCLVENIVPLVFIFPSIWQDGAESLGMETTSCVWFCCCCLYLYQTIAIFETALSFFFLSFIFAQYFISLSTHIIL